MASISTSGDGRCRILFVAADGKRKAIRLGFIDQDEAVIIKKRVAALNVASRRGTPWDPALASWVAGIGEDLAGKLAAVGLIPSREPRKSSGALGPFLAAYIAQRTDYKPNTAKTIEQARRLLIKYFGMDRPLDTITAAAAKNWRNDLRGQGYKPATVATHIKRAKQMFQHAVDDNVLAANPFAKIKAPTQVDKSREVFISHETIFRVIEAAPDAEWRLIIALARFGGLRCPSEITALEWRWIDWEHDRFTVFSPKLEHMPSGGIRLVPIFPELRPFLEDAFDLARPGAVHVIARQRGNNLRTQFERIIRRAGLEPWQRLFNNLRSSRETELTRNFPAHVAANWLGNTVRVATQHYLQMTEDDFLRAAQKAAHFPAQQGAAWAGTDSQEDGETAKKPGKNEELRLLATTCANEQYPRQESNL